jgi:hypothetical protein
MPSGGPAEAERLERFVLHLSEIRDYLRAGVEPLTPRRLRASTTNSSNKLELAGFTVEV